MTNPHLVAFCTNAVSYERVRIEFAIAHENEDGDWEDIFGKIIIPFWVEPFSVPAVEIPEGWIEHLQEVARKNMHRMMAPAKPRLEDLISLPKQPVHRRF